jgi:hypothetical protein
MTAKANLIHVERVERFRSEIQTSEAVRIEQYDFVSEAVGLTLGTMTFCWILTSLCGLA